MCVGRLVPLRVAVLTHVRSISVGVVTHMYVCNSLPSHTYTCTHTLMCTHTQMYVLHTFFCTHATLFVQSIFYARTSGLSYPCRTDCECWCQLWKIIHRLDNSRLLSIRSPISHGSSVCKECFIFDSGMYAIILSQEIDVSVFVCSYLSLTCRF